MKRLKSQVKSKNPSKGNPNDAPNKKFKIHGNDVSSSMEDESPSQNSDKWYTEIPTDPDEFPPCPEATIKQYQLEAKQILESEAKGYEIRASKNSEQNWIRSVMAKGTGRDKIAAFTLMVQEKPIYNIAALRSLVALVKPGKKECTACIDTLVELFIAYLLPPNRKLKTLSQRPLTLIDELSSGNPAGRRRRMALWYFEEQLKSVYKDFVDSLKVIAGESVEANKEKSIQAIAKLLESHPEREAILLSNVVNKMGDPSKKVASKAMHCLKLVLQKHPNMKGVIIDEVERLLFRPNIGSKARYYGVCFLNQIMFKKSDSQLAANLIKIYFSFFKACVKLGDVDSRMLSALLTGVNRAYPYAREAMDSISEQLETLYKVVHMAPFHVSLQGLSLLFHVSDYKNFVSDRFYSVLYRKLLDPSLCVTSHSGMFLNLIFQALKKDESIPRVRAFIKRLLQVCCYLPVPMMCGTLYTISQLLHKRPALSSTSLDLNLKEETDIDSIKEENSKELPSVFLDEESEDEHYEDVPLDESENSRKDLEKKEKVKLPKSWVYKKEGTTKIRGKTFDPTQRNPLYANGEFCSYSELCLLTKHFHPTVALFASQILESKLIKYTGDPLQDFTQIRFLERFCFKNPKKIEPSSDSLFAKRQNYSVSGLKALPITSKAYLSQDETKIPVDERYLFQFLQRRRNKVDNSKHTEENEDDSDVDSVKSDEFEDILEGILKKKGFKKDMDEDEDEDVDFAHEYTKNMSTNRSKKSIEDDDKSDSDDGSDDVSYDEFDEEENEEENPDDQEGNDDENSVEDLDEDPEDEEDFDFGDLDDDAEDIDFDNESEEDLDSHKNSKGKKKKKDFDSVFASAEEFSELLEAAGAAREGSSGAVSNKDKASTKQLNWEAERDRWVKGYNSFTKGGKKFGSKKKSTHQGVTKPSFKAKKKRF